jgi:hypothetical protein
MELPSWNDAGRSVKLSRHAPTDIRGIGRLTFCDIRIDIFQTEEQRWAVEVIDNATSVYWRFECIP